MASDDHDEYGRSAALANADACFAAAACRIVNDMRQEKNVDPERVALEIEFALRGCYWGGGPHDDALRAKQAQLLDLAGGTTTLEIVRGSLPPKRS